MPFLFFFPYQIVIVIIILSGRGEWLTVLYSEESGFNWTHVQFEDAKASERGSIRHLVFMTFPWQNVQFTTKYNPVGVVGAYVPACQYLSTLRNKVNDYIPIVISFNLE